jgi:hypothetical protein
MDGSGNLYGTTNYDGGPSSGGTVFQLTPSGTGWSETVLYRFCSQTNCADGNNPYSGLIMDGSGNLYGTTLYNGSVGSSGGTVFQLTPSGTGWTETVLIQLLLAEQLRRRRFSFRRPDHGRVGQPLRYDRPRRQLLQPHQRGVRRRLRGKPRDNRLHSLSQQERQRQRHGDEFALRDQLRLDLQRELQRGNPGDLDRDRGERLDLHWLERRRVQRNRHLHPDNELGPKRVRRFLVGHL